MKIFHEWLENKYTEWEKNQPGKQTYYTFARFLDVGHSTLTLWITGAALPDASLLPQLAARLGSEIYDYFNQPRPDAPMERVLAGYKLLPAAFQNRLASAVSETAALVAQNKLDPESGDAKRIAVRVFEKWGFKIGS
jgi:hypothetical protein